MAEYRNRRRREISDPPPMSSKKPEVVMTQWVDAECYLVVQNNTNEHVPTPMFDKEAAIDWAVKCKGVVLVIPCIRSHQYRGEEYAQGFVRCPYFAVPHERGGWFQSMQCPQECGHEGEHGRFGDYRDRQFTWKITVDS